MYRLSVEKYPDNRMLGTRELVNGKVYWCLLWNILNSLSTSCV
ncbi:hypothetical protein HanXRQr2_Chr17g0780181 [Helianthus annuus]|uniref:Uncharacterized protein n=1 Tax=Helianthus annuus TaxID=4232 RepID=A0A9K3DGJ0_HELAN|nr:hypothetical protein HanXRQr2_Chr17g0780181 [Helianthus annuus]